MDQRLYKAIGLMSGTSLDGAIDVALIETDGHDHVKPLGFYAHPYDAKIRDTVRACFGKRTSDEETQEAERRVTDIHIEAVKASGFAADVIGFHGQTITHDPPSRDALRRDKPAAAFTWQLGDGARMAQETGIDTVCDFRSADIAAGGQGAPLAPLYHQAIMANEDKPIAVLNLGGVANITYIGDDILAFDCGPANALMDDLMKARTGRDYDENGALAAQGQIHKELFDHPKADAWFALKPPKSLDRNDFDWLMEIVAPLSTEDALATLAAFTVKGIVMAGAHFPAEPKAWYVCGGGRKNGYLMALLQAILENVHPIEATGYDGDAIEAQAFAYLSIRSVLELSISLPTTTGVAEPLTGGVLHRA